MEGGSKIEGTKSLEDSWKPFMRSLFTQAKKAKKPDGSPDMEAEKRLAAQLCPDKLFVV